MVKPRIRARPRIRVRPRIGVRPRIKGCMWRKGYGAEDVVQGIWGKGCGTFISLSLSAVAPSSL